MRPHGSHSPRPGIVGDHDLRMGRRSSTSGIIYHDDITGFNAARIHDPLEVPCMFWKPLRPHVVNGTVGTQVHGHLEAGLRQRVPHELIALVLVSKPLQACASRMAVRRQQGMGTRRNCVPAVLGSVECGALACSLGDTSSGHGGRSEPSPGRMSLRNRVRVVVVMATLPSQPPLRGTAATCFPEVVERRAEPLRPYRKGHRNAWPNPRPPCLPKKPLDPAFSAGDQTGFSCSPAQKLDAISGDGRHGTRRIPPTGQ